MGVDIGVVATVWLPELFPEVATVESEELRRDVKYLEPGHKSTPTLPNPGKRQYSLTVGHLFRKAFLTL